MNLSKAMKKALVAISLESKANGLGACYAPKWHEMKEALGYTEASGLALVARQLIEEGSTGHCDFYALTDAGREAVRKIPAKAVEAIRKRVGILTPKEKRAKAKAERELERLEKIRDARVKSRAIRQAKRNAARVARRLEAHAAKLAKLAEKIRAHAFDAALIGNPEENARLTTRVTPSKFTEKVERIDHAWKEARELTVSDIDMAVEELFDEARELDEVVSN